jgi:hypothetical protein
MDGPFFYDDTSAGSHGAKPACCKQETLIGTMKRWKLNEN